jgi:hypothetical protein
MLGRILTTPTKELPNPSAVGPLPDFLDPSVLAGLDPHEDWISWPGVSVPPAPLLMGTDDMRRDRLSVALTAAAVYALRTVTGNGENMDFDPDDLIAYLQVGMFGYFTETGRVFEEADNSPDAGDCIDMLTEQDPNAPWLSQAHVICSEAGIPAGHISDRLNILGAILNGMRSGPNDAHLTGEVKGLWDGN